LAVEYPRGLDHRGATRLLERAVERTVRELIGKAYPHAVDFAPHDNGIDGLSAIMDFAARARRQARPVDPRSPFGKVADPRLHAVEHPIDGDVEVERCALVMARCVEKGAGHGSVLLQHGKFRVTMTGAPPCRRAFDITQRTRLKLCDAAPRAFFQIGAIHNGWSPAAASPGAHNVPTVGWKLPECSA